MRGDHRANAPKRLVRPAAPAVHDGDHKVGDERPDEDDQHDNEYPDGNYQQDVRFQAISVQRQIVTASDCEENQRRGKQRCKYHKAKRSCQREQKVAIAFCAKLTPRCRDRAAIFDDAVDEHESSARSQPGEQHNKNENQTDEHANACDENRMWNLAYCIAYLLYIFAAVTLIIETAAATSPQVREPCS